MEVVTESGRATSVELRLTPAKIELWHHQSCCSVLDRDDLRQWLREPDESLTAGAVSFSLDRSVNPAGRIALTLPDVELWALAPAVLRQLQRHL